MAKLLSTDPFADPKQAPAPVETAAPAVTPKPIRLSVDLDPDLHYQLRLLALARRVPAASLAREAIAKMVAESAGS